MSRLFDACREVTEAIEAQGLDVFKTRGALALETGFILSLVSEDDPDDADKLAKLRDASRKILGIELHV